MTERIYEKNGDVFEFYAQVTDCSAADGGFETVLDRTAFFPGGGGQQPDSGILICGDRTVIVLSAAERDGVLFHLTDSALPVGTAVRGVLDREKRLCRMQNHSGEHILSGLAFGMFGCNNVGFHMSEDSSGNVVSVTVDFDRELDGDELLRLETEANRAVARNIRFDCFFPSAEELAAMPYRSKKELSGAVRLVSAEGVDLCACCAPHVSQSGQIGEIKIIGAMRYKGGMRLTVCCGAAALKDHRARIEATDRISAMLSVKSDRLPEGVSRLLEAAENEKRTVRELRSALCDRIFESETAPERSQARGVRMIFEPLLDRTARRALAQRVAEASDCACIIFSGSDGLYDYTAAVPEKSASDYALRELASDMRRMLGGSGGGNDSVISGRVTADRKTVEGCELFAEVIKK